jgi:hypothetical protein
MMAEGEEEEEGGHPAAAAEEEEEEIREEGVEVEEAEVVEGILVEVEARARAQRCLDQKEELKAPWEVKEEEQEQGQGQGRGQQQEQEQGRKKGQAEEE